MKFFAVAATGRGFLTAFVIFMLPPLAGLAPVLVFPSASPSISVDASIRTYGVAVILSGLVAPALETWLLIYPTHIARQAIRSHWLVCLVGSAPVVLLHLFQGWGKVLTVLWSFAWSAHCYLALTDQGLSLHKKFNFLFGMHALANVLLLSAAFFVQAVFADRAM